MKRSYVMCDDSSFDASVHFQFFFPVFTDSLFCHLCTVHRIHGILGFMSFHQFHNVNTQSKCSHHVAFLVISDGNLQMIWMEIQSQCSIVSLIPMHSQSVDPINQCEYYHFIYFHVWITLQIVLGVNTSWVDRYFFGMFLSH